MCKDLYLKTPNNTLLRFQVFLPSKNNDKPTILFLQGRGTFLEKNIHTINRLQADGYEVWIFDWRGQGLSTRILGRRGYIPSYSMYIRDLHYFISKFFKKEKNSRPLIILGQSMGAHIGLRYMMEYPKNIDGAILTAPMLELNTGIYSYTVARILSNLMCLLGLGKNYVFGHDSYDQSSEEFAGNLLTRNRELFCQHQELCRQKPELVVGGATFGWVKASMNSSQKLLNKKRLNKLLAPILLYYAENDKIVSNRKIKYFSQNTPNCQTVCVPKARHVLQCELGEVQNLIHNGLNNFVRNNFQQKYKKCDILSQFSNVNGVYDY